MTDTRAVWSADAPTSTLTPLVRDVAADVCVVGAGIAGLSAAVRIRETGRSVLVLDADSPCGGETRHTTAHLSWLPDRGFRHVAAVRGDAVAGRAAATHRAAIDDIECIIRNENIECEFRRVDGYLFAGGDDSQAVDREAEVLRRLALPFDAVGAVPLAGRAGLKVPGTARFHPGKYLRGLATAARTHGCDIHSGTRVVKIAGGAPCRVETEGGAVITAGAVVIATNVPFDAGVAVHARLAAYTTYAIAVPVPPGSVPDALYWDTADPFHYARVLPAGEGRAEDLLIVGGEDHKTGQAADQGKRWGRLEAWAKTLVPAARAATFHWSGQVFETADGLGLIGPAPWGENLYVITGDCGSGLTHGTLGGRLVADLIAGAEGDAAAVYDPGRWTPAAAYTLLKENANLAAQYADWLGGGDVQSAEEIPPGQGAVIARGLGRVAVYRRPDGTVCEHAAACPHLGAAVRWNPGEGTWDCPAHGSRFAADGRVLHGPAVAPLAAS